MSWSHTRRRAFTLLELLVALTIVALLASGLAVPMAAQLQQRRLDEARRQLDEAKEALLGSLPRMGGFRARGRREPRAGELHDFGDATKATGPLSRWLPAAAALGLAPLDAEGFQRDPWGSPRNRLRYAVFGAGSR
jgi:prepilin-type N-terminal cleavage/methylation domain-containing protein